MFQLTSAEAAQLNRTQLVIGSESTATLFGGPEPITKCERLREHRDLESKECSS